jgi:hypothetical protein
MAVRVARVHPPNAPRLIGRRHADLDAFLQAMPMSGVNIFDANRHPNALVCLIAVLIGRRKIALASATLRALAKEDLESAGANEPEGGRAAPIETLFPAELLELGEAIDDVGLVQDRGQPICDHGRPCRSRR